MGSECMNWLVPFKVDLSNGMSTQKLGMKYYADAHEGRMALSPIALKSWAQRTIKREGLEKGSAVVPVAVKSDVVPDAKTAEKCDEEYDYKNGTRLLAVQTKNRINGVDDLARLYNVDLEVWEAVQFKPGTYEVTTKAPDGTVTTTPMYVSRATFVKKKIAEVKEDYEEILNQFIAKAASHAPTYLPIARTPKQRNLALEICIPDAHFGKLCRGAETGFGNYDLNIAKQRYQDAISAILGSVDHDTIEQILFVTGNDFLNSDNKSGTTERGTPQDNDSRYHKVFDVATETLIAAIENFRLIAPVKVLNIPGNHDRLSAWHMGRQLKMWFRNADDVEVDSSDTMFKCWEFGNVLLGFTHGDGGKRKDYPLDLAVQFPEQWGRTRFREIHTGDKHQLRVEESKGVRVRILPSLSEEDCWHSTSRYIGNIKSAEAFVWHREDGLRHQHSFNVVPILNES